jgi:nucleoside-diphosphate-sugar epimerase
MKIAITGGAGYVGSALVPHLESLGHQLRVVDLFLYGEDVIEGTRAERVKGDIRDPELLMRTFQGMDAVIHLACISNDPSFELDPALGKTINYDAFDGILRAVRENRVRRFIYASSSSVYGLRDEPNVREDAPCTPLTDYSKYKLLCEADLKRQGTGAEWVILRPSTVCGYARRMRLDLVVNILTINALAKGEITVFGGKQLRPNLHIKDMVEAYRVLLEAPAGKVHGETFNVGYENFTVSELAEKVRSALGDPSIRIQVKPTDDLRSYHVNSDKIRGALGFSATHTIEEAVQDIAGAWKSGRLPDALNDPRYVNIKLMQKINLAGKAVART